MRSLVVLPALLLASAAIAADGELSAGAGIDYSKGDYGTGSETKILSIPFMARYDSDPWKLKLTVPYLRVTGEGEVIPGIGRTNRGRRSETTMFATRVAITRSPAWRPSGTASGPSRASTIERSGNATVTSE